MIRKTTSAVVIGLFAATAIALTAGNATARPTLISGTPSFVQDGAGDGGSGPQRPTGALDESDDDAGGQSQPQHPDKKPVVPPTKGKSDGGKGKPTGKPGKTDKADGDTADDDTADSDSSDSDKADSDSDSSSADSDDSDSDHGDSADGDDSSSDDDSSSSGGGLLGGL
ncbi:hypothetical protein OG203_28995 [Nocardia sp. NBC_01499]|uniref:hypothetical protein n=1 Tax=Nocardia sp. NBC_01499 TaxID=2903597 RepID=UPI00386AC350